MLNITTNEIVFSLSRNYCTDFYADKTCLLGHPKPLCNMEKLYKLLQNSSDFYFIFKIHQTILTYIYTLELQRI